jgi:uncharacterized membrane protein
VPEKDVILLNISVDDAVKMIISGGIIGPEDRHLLTETSPVELSSEGFIY